MKSVTAQQKKFLLALPVIVVPFLCLIFYEMGGGRASDKGASAGQGINPELPKARFDPKKVLMDKLASYEKASHDSMVRQKYQQQDPYSSTTRHATAEVMPSFRDPKADELQQQLRQLQQTLDQPMPLVRQRPIPQVPAQRNEAPESDPQLEKLNGMLDKVLRIQHPSEPGQVSATVGSTTVDEVQPADSTSNTISAVVPEKQVLVTGATIALRLTDEIRVNRILIPRGQLVYGVANINNDRMLIRITAIRSDRNIYTTDLQVFDLDGLEGIHIPGQISRDVTKQSADQGISSLNLMTYDPSLGGQAANAGVQAAKSLFSRKVRQVRVTVRPGYQLLLRNTKANHSPHSTELPGEKPGVIYRQPPGFVPGGSFLQSCSEGGVEFGLQGIYLKDEVLWFALTTHNSSAITYIPESIRWFIRDRRVFRRTAVQVLPLKPVYQPEQSAVVGDSSCSTWTGFRPFALAKDKELVIEMGEKNGGRALLLVIGHKQILKAQKIEAYGEATQE
ncbi:MAG TPA: conjugative transposon protein TraM [Puia sp.]|jgi:hypothetical protein